MSPLEALSVMAQTADAFVAGKRPTLNECVLVQQALLALQQALTPSAPAEPSKPLANLVPALDKAMAAKKGKP